MRVIDWRSRVERAVAGAPTEQRFWHRPATWLADRLVARRAAKRLPPSANRLVVSVGNLRVGGTGKTPVVMQLARDLAGLGWTGGVITRGYGAADSTPRIVEQHDHRAGDEARLLAGTLRPLGWNVAQSADRVRGLALLDAEQPTREDVVILEDAHQSAGCGRHLDILILDRWDLVDGIVHPTTGPVVPFGPYRESARGAARAAVWLLEDEVPEASWAPEGVTLVGFQRRLEIPATAAGEVVGLVSGLARPERFEQSVGGGLPDGARLAVRLADHAAYGATDLQRLARLAQEHGVQRWLTTGKDHIKLAPIWNLPQPLEVVGLDLAWTTTPTLPELVAERRRDLTV